MQQSCIYTRGTQTSCAEVRSQQKVAIDKKGTKQWSHTAHLLRCKKINKKRKRQITENLIKRETNEQLKETTDPAEQ